MKHTAGGSVTYNDQLRALEACVDHFSKRMKAKLEAKLREGYIGWDERDFDADKFLETLKRNLDALDMVDVANLAMFVWNQQT